MRGGACCYNSYVHVYPGMNQKSAVKKRAFIPVLGAPALDKADSDGAHVGQGVDGFESIVDAILEQSCKVLIVEDFQVTSYKGK